MQSRLSPSMWKDEPESGDSPSSWAGTLAGCTAFLLYGGFTILQFSQPNRPVYPWFNALSAILFWVPMLISCGMVALAWLKNFPRWSTPYVAMSLLFTVILCFYSPAGFLPLLLTVALAWLVTRSTKPLVHLLNQGLEDWTVVAFGAFGTLPFWMEAFCDLVDPYFAIPWFVALTLLMAGIALVYLRSPHFRQRSLVIGIGLFLALIAFILGPRPSQYIKYGWVDIIPMIIATLSLWFILLSPVLLVKLIQFWWRPQPDQTP